MNKYNWPLPTAELTIDEFEDLYPGALQLPFMNFRICRSSTRDADMEWDLGRLGSYNVTSYQEDDPIDKEVRAGFVLRLKDAL